MMDLTALHTHMCVAVRYALLLRTTVLRSTARFIVLTFRARHCKNSVGSTSKVSE